MTGGPRLLRLGARLLRPPVEPWWTACLVVVVGLVVSVALYAAFGGGLHPVGETLGFAVLLPGPPFVLVAWLAIRMGSSLLGIAAAVVASALALALAWDATVNGTGSTAALAIVAAPPFMAVCGIGALVLDQVVRALADRSLRRARPSARSDGERRRRRIGLIVAIVGVALAGLVLVWNHDPFEDTAARSAGVDAVRCEPRDSSVVCSLLGPAAVVLAYDCFDGDDALIGCEFADPLPAVDIPERWWTVATRLRAQGIRFRFSIAVEDGSMGRWGSRFVGTDGEGRRQADWTLLVEGGRAADPSSARSPADEIVGDDPTWAAERDFERGDLVDLIDGSTLWVREGVRAELRDRIAAAVAYA